MRLIIKLFKLSLLNFLFVQCTSSMFTGFISRNNDKLMDGDKEYHFISFSIPNLNYIEDYLPFDCTNPWRLPNEFEIRDALLSIKQMGGKVCRMYVLSVRKESDTPDIIRYVEGPGKFNEEAFRTLDKVLQVANEVGIRVIIPFVDNWHWWGGPKEYAAFRGKERDEFWTDSLLILDFKKTIKFVINRKNTFTGQLYKDDKAILAWETGNELLAPFSWTKEIAAYIKSLDKNHLLIEGRNSPELTEEAVDDTNIDILSTHHYRDTKTNIEQIIRNKEISNGKKPYIIGEYGLVPAQEIREITDTIISQHISGGLLWSLRFRNRDGGFYNHYEYNNMEAYHWPGFPSGDIYDEKSILNLIREKAYQIDGEPVPQIPKPEAPNLLKIKNAGEISWQGSVGAQTYTLERKEKLIPGWTVIAENIDETEYPYRPLYIDDSTQFGKEYYYRVKAVNESGESDYSNTIGPVKVEIKKFVDELENFDKVFQKDGNFRFMSIMDVRKAKEERNRLACSEGSYLIYKAPQITTSVKIDFFPLKDENAIKIFSSDDMISYNEVSLKKEYFKSDTNDYGFFNSVRFTADTIPHDTKFIKIILSDSVQLSRIEINYKK